MNQWGKKCNEASRDIYEAHIKKIIEKNNCKSCGCKIKQVGRRKFGCTNCEKRYTTKPYPIFFRDMSDTRNWKSKCEECGGIMDYFNFRYGCRKCGHILEV